MLFLDVYTQVSKDFETCAKLLCQGDKDMERFILEHERRPLVTEQLCRQISLLEAKFGKQNVMAERRKIVAGVTEMFFKAAKAHRDQANMSDIQKHTISPEERAKSDMQELLKEVGVEEEAGQTAN